MKLGKGDPSKHLFIGKSVLTIPNIKATISGVNIKGYYISGYYQRLLYQGLLSRANVSVG